MYAPPPSVHGKHVVERKACGVRSANIRTAQDIVKRNARGLDLQKYATQNIVPAFLRNPIYDVVVPTPRRVLAIYISRTGLGPV